MSRTSTMQPPPGFVLPTRYPAAAGPLVASVSDGAETSQLQNWHNLCQCSPVHQRTVGRILAHGGAIAKLAEQATGDAYTARRKPGGAGASLRYPRAHAPPLGRWDA